MIKIRFHAILLKIRIAEPAILGDERKFITFLKQDVAKT